MPPPEPEHDEHFCRVSSACRAASEAHGPALELVVLTRYLLLLRARSSGRKVAADICNEARAPLCLARLVRGQHGSPGTRVICEHVPLSTAMPSTLTLRRASPVRDWGRGGTVEMALTSVQPLSFLQLQALSGTGVGVGPWRRPLPLCSLCPSCSFKLLLDPRQLIFQKRVFFREPIQLDPA